MTRMWPALILLLFLGNGLASVARCQDRIWRPYFEMEGRGGMRELGQGTLFVPLVQDCENLLFADLRGLWTDVQSAEGNWGLAFRRIDGDCIIGAYGFFDLLHSQFNNNFAQVTVGGELLSVNWGLRANGYIPESKVAPAAALTSVSLQDGQLFVDSSQESAYWGLDLEAEGLLWWGQGTRDGRPSLWALERLDAEIWGAAGFFHFESSCSCMENIAGPRARCELRLYDLAWVGPDSRLVLGAQFEYDAVRGSVGMGSLSVRIPFGPGGGRRDTRLSPLQRRMVNPIVRDIDIVSNTCRRTEPALLAATGQRVTQTIVVDANDDLVAAVAAAGSNSLVMVDGSAGPLDIDNTAVMSTSQAVVGGGTQLAVVGADSGVTARFTVPGARPAIDGPGGSQSTLRLTDNGTIQGIDFVDGREGISGFNVSGFLIADNHFASYRGVALGGSIHGDIIGNSATGPSTGFSVADFRSGTIAGNTASGNYNGFYFSNMMGGTVTGNTSNNNTENGFVLFDFSGGRFSGNVATDNVGAGYSVLNRSGGTATGNTGSGNGSNDVYPYADEPGGGDTGT